MTQFRLFASSDSETMLRTVIVRHSLYLCLISSIVFTGVDAETQCWKRKYYVNIFGRALNATVLCPKFYQWTVSDYCCYDAFDRFDSRPYCCYSETYKLLIAVGLICLVLLGLSICLILCWIYSIPHYIIYALTCGKFSLLKYMKKGMVNGPYVDPSFYSGEPFWSPGNADIQPYPLRPMPPRIFYPTVPRNMKSRWMSKEAFPNGQMPLFILASRQFTRNPYSARPNERQAAAAITAGTGPMSASSSFSSGTVRGRGHYDQNSRRSSTTSTIVPDSQGGRSLPTLNFRVNIDEVEAAAELLEALKNMDDKCEKDFIIPRLTEETQMDLDLENEKIDDFREIRRHSCQAGKGYDDQGPPSISAVISRRTSAASAVHAAMGAVTFAPSQSIMEELSLNTLLNTSARRMSNVGDGGSKNPNIPGFIPDERI